MPYSVTPQKQTEKGERDSCEVLRRAESADSWLVKENLEDLQPLEH